MTATTPVQIELMQSVCKSLTKNPLVQSAVVDDWGRFGNFTLMVTPSVSFPYATQRLKGAVRQALKSVTDNQAHLRQCFGPDPVYSYEDGHRVRVGFNRTYWVMDVDFFQYDPCSNSFS